MCDLQVRAGHGISTGSPSSVCLTVSTYSGCAVTVKRNRGANLNSLQLTMPNHHIEMPRAPMPSPQGSTTDKVKPPQRPGALLIAFTVFFTVLHGFLMWALAAHRADPSYAFGQILGGALMGPLIIVALFQ